MYRCSVLPSGCRDYGGLHRSDFQDCQARLRKTGPVKKEQFAQIPHIAQERLAAVGQARTATKRAEAAIIASKNRRLYGSGIELRSSEV